MGRRRRDQFFGRLRLPRLQLLPTHTPPLPFLKQNCSSGGGLLVEGQPSLHPHSGRKKEMPSFFLGGAFFSLSPCTLHHLSKLWKKKNFFVEVEDRNSGFILFIQCMLLYESPPHLVFYLGQGCFGERFRQEQGFTMPAFCYCHTILLLPTEKLLKRRRGTFYCDF